MKAAVDERNRAEFAILDELLAARKAAGLTQAQIAKRMGTQTPASARLERALATGKNSLSLNMLTRDAQALGKRVEARLCDGLGFYCAFVKSPTFPRWSRCSRVPGCRLYR